MNCIECKDTGIDEMFITHVNGVPVPKDQNGSIKVYCKCEIGQELMKSDHRKYDMENFGLEDE